MIIVGTTTIVRQSDGMPEEKSRRGSRRGFTSRVLSQFISATASWLAPSRNSRPKSDQSPAIHLKQPGLPHETGRREQGDQPDASRIERQREIDGCARPMASRHGQRTFAAFSNMVRPLSIR